MCAVLTSTVSTHDFQSVPSEPIVFENLWLCLEIDCMCCVKYEHCGVAFVRNCPLRSRTEAEEGLLCSLFKSSRDSEAQELANCD